MAIRPSNGDGFDLPDVDTFNFGMVTSRFVTGEAGGEVIFPITKGNRALKAKEGERNCESLTVGGTNRNGSGVLPYLRDDSKSVV
jgi:hypothetical protein